MNRVKILILTLLCLSPIFCITVNASYVQEDGKTYKIVDGKKYEVDRGSNDDQSITDEFKTYTDKTTPDSKTMKEVGGAVTTTAGTVISVIIYLIFAFTFFTTACDILYIAVPSVRPYLYDGQQRQQQQQQMGMQQQPRMSSQQQMNMQQAQMNMQQSQMNMQQAQMNMQQQQQNGRQM